MVWLFEELRAALSCSIHSLTFTPRASSYDFDFDHSKSNCAAARHCPAELRFVSIQLDDLKMPGAGGEDSFVCPDYKVPVMISQHKTQPNKNKPPRLVIYCHGNSATIGEKADSFAEVCHQLYEKHDQDWTVVSLEQPGYGLASPVAHGCVPKDTAERHKLGTDPRDIVLQPSPLVWRAVLRGFLWKLAKNTDIDLLSHVVIVGRSMGTGLVLETVAAVPQFSAVSAVALISPPARIGDVIGDAVAARAGGFIGRWVAQPLFDCVCNNVARTQFFDSVTNIAKIRKQTPMRIFHGAQDFFVKLINAKRLLAARKASAADVAAVDLIVDPNAHHGNVQYEKELVEFISEVGKKMVLDSDSDSAAEFSLGGTAASDASVQLMKAELEQDKITLAEFRAEKKKFLRTTVVVCSGIVFVAAALGGAKLWKRFGESAKNVLAWNY